MVGKASVLREEFESLERRGFQRVRIDNQIKRLDDYDLLPEKSAGREFTVELVIDRFVIKMTVFEHKMTITSGLANNCVGAALS